jgi:hypothetical protein
MWYIFPVTFFHLTFDINTRKYVETSQLMHMKGINFFGRLTYGNTAVKLFVDEFIAMNFAAFFFVTVVNTVSS